MLKNQKAIYLVVGLVAGLFMAFVANKFIFTNSGSKDTTVDVVPVIKTDFETPPTKYFNSQAVDPTQIINIAPNNSQQPFSGQ